MIRNTNDYLCLEFWTFGWSLYRVPALLLAYCSYTETGTRGNYLLLLGNIHRLDYLPTYLPTMAVRYMRRATIKQPCAVHDATTSVQLRKKIPSGR
jgi:hypothetical protein